MEKLFRGVLINNGFGEDISGMMFDIDVRDSSTTSGFARRKLPLPEAVQETIEQITELSAFKWLNPLY